MMTKSLLAVPQALWCVALFVASIGLLAVACKLLVWHDPRKAYGKYLGRED